MIVNTMPKEAAEGNMIVYAMSMKAAEGNMIKQRAT